MNVCSGGGGPGPGPGPGQGPGPGGVVCPTDVKQCKDGTTVSRDPNNNCQFPPCLCDNVTCDPIKTGSCFWATRGGGACVAPGELRKCDSATGQCVKDTSIQDYFWSCSMSECPGKCKSNGDCGEEKCTGCENHSWMGCAITCELPECKDNTCETIVDLRSCNTCSNASGPGPGPGSGSGPGATNAGGPGSGPGTNPGGPGSGPGTNPGGPGSGPGTNPGGPGSGPGPGGTVSGETAGQTSGDTAGISGDTSGISGETSGISGDTSDTSGETSGTGPAPDENDDDGDGDADDGISDNDDGVVEDDDGNGDGDDGQEDNDDAGDEQEEEDEGAEEEEEEEVDPDDEKCSRCFQGDSKIPVCRSVGTACYSDGETAACRSADEDPPPGLSKCSATVEHSCDACPKSCPSGTSCYTNQNDNGSTTTGCYTKRCKNWPADAHKGCAPPGFTNCGLRLLNACEKHCSAPCPRDKPKCITRKFSDRSEGRCVEADVKIRWWTDCGTLVADDDDDAGDNDDDGDGDADDGVPDNDDGDIEDDDGNGDGDDGVADNDDSDDGDPPPPEDEASSSAASSEESSEPQCGDGIPEGDEQCDDGNDVNDDACTNACEDPRCGDEIVQEDEECDDGNDVQNDGCSNQCTLPECGNGICELGEADSCACYDPSDDACYDCTPGSCIEDCGPSATHYACREAACALVPGQGTNGCQERNDCSHFACELGQCVLRLSSGVDQCADNEQCPDPVAFSSAAVESSSSASSQLSLVIIGNPPPSSDDDDDGGTVVVYEDDDLLQLDDYVAAQEEERARQIAAEQEAAEYEAQREAERQAEIEEERLVAAASVCGDGQITGREECDDSNRRNDDGCSETCKLEVGVCGDGRVQELLDEQCEASTHDKNLPYGCVNCRFLSSTCGDNVIDAGEECDRGLRNSDEPNGICRTDCSHPRCGDGVLDDRDEECDDGNRVNGDGCNRRCEVETMVAGVDDELKESPQEEPAVVGTDASYVEVIYEKIVRGEVLSDQEFEIFQAAVHPAAAQLKHMLLSGYTKQHALTQLAFVAAQGQSQGSPFQLPYGMQAPFGQHPLHAQFPQAPGLQPLPLQLPLAQLQPLTTRRAPIGDTGPAAVAIIGAGAAAGFGWIRRKRR